MEKGLTKVRNIVAHVMVLRRVQSDEQCCNSCEEVREAYKKKGWALTNPDLIDQKELGSYLYESLLSVPNIRIYGAAPWQTDHRAPLCSFNVENVHSRDIAATLDAQFDSVRLTVGSQSNLALRDAIWSVDRITPGHCTIPGQAIRRTPKGHAWKRRTVRKVELFVDLNNHGARCCDDEGF